MRYQRVKNVAWRRIGDETVVVNLGRRRMLALNEAGGAVWEALAGGGGVEPGEAAPFLADLEAEGVVERVADEDGAAVTVPGTPTVIWREELHHFGGGCSLMPDQSPLCDQNPQIS
jgi:hypothetical protein